MFYYNHKPICFFGELYNNKMKKNSYLTNKQVSSTFTNNNNNNNNNQYVSPRPGNTGLMSSGYSLISPGEESSLVLVGNPSREGVSIKILVWRHFKPNPQLL